MSRNTNEGVLDIVREIRDVASKYGVKVFGQIMYSRGDLADRIEKEFRRDISENARLRDVVYALKACPGIRNCLIKGCASCSHHENGCNSKAVVVALRRFNESDGKWVK